MRIFAGRRFLFEADVARTFQAKLVGIMFRNTPLRGPFVRPLFFAFVREGAASNAIHSLFCFTRFDAVFLDGAFHVTEILHAVAPWNPLITPKKPCRYLIELPAGMARRLGLIAGMKLNW
jgi:uncharacterized membrane protein (UPF0127 family)